MPKPPFADLSEESSKAVHWFAKYGQVLAQNSADAEGYFSKNTRENDQESGLTGYLHAAH